LFEGVGVAGVRLDEFCNDSIVIGVLFVEYFVEAVLIERLPSMQLESVFIFAALFFLNLLPYFM
jgi:hypothetical protein